ncbi:FAD/NAD(P)-binding domain-containing protein [Hyaloscypha bicolor E]|uniref:FAD/NAD(P)-binding domain-containing protein n=1 Tax=Hyaloscypha bicolor E TaxID=1095630 RepID=A0A2J6SPS7_9HELO|nr:FAD/NAD(P)-binding domain-containing protein [Hyaloscypha bicolor E]PMD52776.1 FAD/NAD(P)-binding domain-containing protein [Hyaloscypha bicolor E]
MTFYRPDLHSELLRLCMLQSSEYKSPKLLLGSEVATVDINNATVVLTNGSSISGDLVIGADGERSLVKAAFKELDTLRPAPYRIFRAIVPTETLVDNKRQWPVLSLTTSKFAIFRKGTRILSWFEGRDGFLQDLEAGYNISLDEDQGPETDPVKVKQKMLHTFSDYHPSILAALRKAERVSDWPVYYSTPLAHLHKGRAVLIGDAAHSMLPTTGQGGTQSLEDICALAIFLHSDSLKGKRERQVEERLAMFEELRKERMAIVQAGSGIMFGDEERLEKTKWGQVLKRAGIRDGEGHLRFLYQYDIFEESRKALEEGMRAKARL